MVDSKSNSSVNLEGVSTPEGVHETRSSPTPATTGVGGAAHDASGIRVWRSGGEVEEQLGLRELLRMRQSRDPDEALGGAGFGVVGKWCRNSRCSKLAKTN